RPLETAFGQPPVQRGGVREALIDTGVDPLPVAVQPRPVRTTETPRWARLAPQVAEHRPARQAQYSAPAAAILLPAAFFFSALPPDATRPNAVIYLAYVGAGVVALGLLVLGVGLLRGPQDEYTARGVREDATAGPSRSAQ